MPESFVDRLSQIAGLEAVWAAVSERAIAHRRSLPSAWPQSIAELSAVQSGIARRGAWTTGPSTMLDVLGLSRAEVVNCRVLAWLLDPLARHGLGTSLLERFGGEVGAEALDERVTRVDVEVARNETRADVVLSASGVAVVVVEAKIDAGEQPNQARRLETEWPEAERFVFLTPGGRRLPSTANDAERWRPLAWPRIAQHVAECVTEASPASSERVAEARHVAADWAAGIRRTLA